LVDLVGGPQRWSELRRRAGGVSDKMLAQTLRELEAGGMITRTVHASRPPTVEYGLTDLARGAVTALRQLQDWAEEHTDEYAHRQADSGRVHTASVPSERRSQRN
jgi:DNA-binding HxlR family transcriptional regulator